MSDDSSTNDRFIGDPPEPSVGTGEGGPSPDDKPMALLIELNVRYSDGLDRCRANFFNQVWEHFAEWAGRQLPGPVPSGSVPAGLVQITPTLYQCLLTRQQCRNMLAWDRRRAEGEPARQTIFKVWPDYTLRPQIDRSVITVKVDAAHRCYGARGDGIVWAVIDSGIDATHPHFSALELGRAATSNAPLGRTGGLHRDFRSLVRLTDDPPAPPEEPLADELGHGTHVAGILAGEVPAGRTPHVAGSSEPADGQGYIPRPRIGRMRGMAPACELVSLKVLRRDEDGNWITSSAAVIAALEYLRTTVNADPSVLTVHGVNISLACPWEPKHYAAGRSPLSRAVNRLVDSGVVVVVAAGNFGGDTAVGPSAMSAIGSIAEPAHAEGAIAVGSTHRESPHSFGVTWNSSKGPTLDGRMKPDLVAPGEWITSAATGSVRRRAGLGDVQGPDSLLTYAEQCGTSMAAPHVSGAIAAFLSVRPEFIGQPRKVAQLLAHSATDLGRVPYAQGAGLIDLMRLLASV
jgi:subtilisin family serine protease